MTVKVGINGFGRIGRNVFKGIKERVADTVEVVAINDLFNAETNAHLFKYDTNYGRYPGTVEVKGNDLVIDNKVIKIFSERDPGNLPWKDLGVEIVIEATGIFKDSQIDPGPRSHIEKGGAKKVIISAPAKNEDLTIVLGVNDDLYDPAVHHIISNASCTTNCLAPAAKVVNDSFGIVKGLMTTVHSYTNGQRILDLAHTDPRRARAAALNIIPTTTGAAKAVAKVIPELEGKFDGYALRVPTPTVSIVDFVAETKKSVSLEALKSAFKEAADGPMAGILGYCEEPLVSVDFKGDSRSSIVDADLLMVMGDNMVKVVAWYDNEWAYSARTADLAGLLAKSL
ncbi:MAG: type I glyceraldehyde-3-phosphate dehydrogenase [Anaerolineae bacterium]|nr:type I glyceraldehyde-3-phosphate dehydrogenase [Anaerolineae bacterium]MDK1081357.1 type I glyceraldehyde-3-phosphate dehydrogenase [Anaerolineae bacterium]MDK1117924.1 type I glyceraldehyde-3-phosphate dehydrogenase [Anaerolineae bacterium]